jgi:GH25 family lysozyme M1 (1,4-beta-N-acetylmuramidase)
VRPHLENNDDERAWIDAQSTAAPPSGPVTRGPGGPTVDQFHVHGKDVSSYQPIGHFNEGNRRFAIMKATEGITYADPHFVANREEAHADPAIEAVGIYHFARNQRNPVGAEYAHFRAVVGPPRPGEFMVLDAEVGWDQPWFCAFADAAAQDGWRVRVFYTYAGMWAPNPHNKIAEHFTDGWVAGYSRTLPPMPGWPNGPTLWQHSDGQPSVPGNDGSTDCSVFLPNDVDALRAWVGAPHEEDDDMAKLFDTLEEFQAAVRTVVDDAVRAAVPAPSGWQDGVPFVIGPEVPVGVKVPFHLVGRRDNNSAGGQAVWVLASDDVVVDSCFTDKRGKNIGDHAPYTPGVAGTSVGPVVEPATGMWVERKSGDGVIVVQIFSPEAGA